MVTTDGILPLTIGASMSANPGVAMARYDENYCYSEVLGTTTGDLGLWLGDYDGAAPIDGNIPQPFGLTVFGDVLVRIDVWDASLATPEGIHVGSTLAQVQAAYPALVTGSAGGTSDVYWIEGSHGYVVFETQDDSDGFQPAGTPMTVIHMRVIDAGSDPDFAIANSGNTGGCAW